ncbi:MAG: hypothetical protein IPH23_03960 [Gammaproteobacteria bacterium]|nr:hypothetical protein [Gammaproteobacteria bacterium]
MGFTQSGFTTSVPHTLDEQSRHIAYILRQVVDHGIRSFAATQGVLHHWPPAPRGRASAQSYPRVEAASSVARAGRRPWLVMPCSGHAQGIG